MKIRFKIAIILLSTITLFGLLNSYIEYSRTFDRENGLLKESGFTIARNSSFNIFHHLSTNDIVEAQRMINSIKENEKDILYVFVLSPEGKVIIHTFDKRFPSDLLTFNTKIKKSVKLIKYGDETAYDFSYPIESGELGVIRIGISRKNLLAYLTNNLVHSLELLFVFFVLGLILILWLSRLLTKPISQLMVAVKKVADGDYYTAYSKVKSNDEIGKLSTAFNNMVKELQNSKEQLETSIEEVIKELQLRKEAEKKLSESEKFLNEIFDAITNPIMVYNVEDYSIVTYNEAANKKYIQTNAEGKTVTCYNLTHNRDLPCEDEKHPCPLKIIKKTRKPAEVEHIHINAEGKQKYFKINAFPIFDNNGNLKQIIEYSIDITESKKAAEELLKVKLGIERLDEAVFITDIDGKITYANPGFEKMYGFSKDEVIGKTPRIIKSGKIPQNVYKDFWDKLLNKEVIVGELINKTKDGKFKTIFSTANPIIDKKNKLIGFLAIQRDISEQKLAEKELITAKENAEKADKLKSAFLAQMSHEIRTPINAIVSLSSLLRDDLKDEVDDEKNLTLDLIGGAGRRIVRTVELLLNLAEIQAGTYEIIRRKFDLFSDIIGKLLVEFKIYAKEKGIALESKVEAESTEFVGDIYTIEQIFTQLLENAIKYTDKGKVLVKIYRNENQNLIVEVKDTGIGIAEEYLDEIFEPFSQEEMGYSRKYEGNGIGLSLVKSYCNLNNIKVEVESEKGKGSTFRVIF